MKKMNCVFLLIRQSKGDFLDPHEARMKARIGSRNLEPSD